MLAFASYLYYIAVVVQEDGKTFREIGVSSHQGGPIEGPHEISLTVTVLWYWEIISIILSITSFDVKKFLIYTYKLKFLKI